MTPATVRACALALATFVVAGACGHKGPPVPPLRRTPPNLADFRLAQRGDALEVSLTAPRASVDGVAFRRLEVEIFWGEGQVDLEKAGRSKRVRADPGARVVETLPLPPPGTLVRAAGRAIAGGADGQRTIIRSLEVQPPLAVPHDLAVELREEGVALSWQGERPEPVEPPERGGLGGLRLPFSGGPDEASPPLEEGESTAALPGEEAESASPDALDEQGAEEVPEEEEAEAELGTHGFSVYRRLAPGIYRQPLHPEPLQERTLVDRTAPLGADVCYVVRAVGSVDPLIESASSNEACLEVRDIVAPSTPTGLAVVPREGGLEIVWTPSPEADLAGYRIYRAIGEPGAEGELVGEVEVGTTSWTDTATEPVVFYNYTVTAIDKAGNESPPSDGAGGRRP